MFAKGLFMVLAGQLFCHQKQKIFPTILADTSVLERNFSREAKKSGRIVLLTIPLFVSNVRLFFQRFGHGCGLAPKLRSNGFCRSRRNCRRIRRWISSRSFPSVHRLCKPVHFHAFISESLIKRHNLIKSGVPMMEGFNDCCLEPRTVHISLSGYGADIIAAPPDTVLLWFQHADVLHRQSVG